MDGPQRAEGLYDVAIVGFGPVGATLANLLAVDGLSVIAFDREPTPYALPRAVHFDDEVMRIFQTIGLADEILPFTHVSPGMHFVDGDGRLFLDWSRPLQVGPNGWNASYRFHQPDLERVLRAGASAHASVDIRLRTDVFALDQRGDHVAIRFESLANGRLDEARARYVVGCDGARSLVRRLIGSDVEDLGFHEQWLVVDAILKRPKPELGDYSVQFCDARRPATYVRSIGNRRRWEIAVMPDDDARRITDPGNVWKLLARWITPGDAELERAACYSFHSVIASAWRRARLLIAGDAAHQTPPFLGQGMCAGIRDAANLAWKLGRVIRGEASDVLLDSYQTERHPHVREYIELAVRLGSLINATRVEGREAGAEPRRMATIKPRLGPGLFRRGCAVAGTLAPQPMLSNGCRLDDHVGYRFAALVRPDFLDGLDIAIRESCGKRGIALVAAGPGPLSSWLDSVGAHAALVRPDRYIVGLAQTPQELSALIDTMNQEDFG
ncbi:bifunctional 3-(3-hydroxy-phenyl)propionate/3-hydroxycinnamic acid hydroxylase [Bradyrhizobium jicamae]|uniref:bifunctional 3-(3-hydroxy-phenyl)propionate/3-hydroxycinnamic acid hydroxylase MhpA n=1 Tax=Bradyrhizobium jicamae TaxID=280332 RepID=UPI001BAA820A|nr:bifunctional 3-(3-hydroxy-phenyl)propionate/3-hydroxycinnamic acid hydroxylase [Bradyrhizobium jicamae]MBR0935460.1 bifunctional 3-(3-hydroxy-phenyl)propionate/3-hydroxycinnamic acid hydroxylase [Bradyrhizobium jicamae]